MTHTTNRLISFVIPVFNEAAGLRTFHTELMDVIATLNVPYEVLYCDDGSSDNTAVIIRELHDHDSRISLVRLSRNFGKEAALAAGISKAKGAAIIMIDGDGQHPVELIPQFIGKWRNGARVVVGIRTENTGEGSFKHYGSKFFYTLFNRFASQPLIPGSSDFRLIDHRVQKAFLTLNENDRITRGLIDWLGFTRDYVQFKAKPRRAGNAAYSRRKLVGLAANSFVSLTSTPMFLFGYLGVIITLASLILGIAIIIEQLILSDPLLWDFTGTAMLGVLLVFLVGIVLMSQGILSVYISHIHTQAKQRPLYIIDEPDSDGSE